MGDNECPSEDYLRKLYHNGQFSKKEIAHSEQVEYRDVLEWFTFYGINEQYPSEVELLEMYYLDKMTLDQIAKAKRTYKEKVMKWFDFYGIQTKSREDRWKDRKVRWEEEAKRWNELFEDGGGD
jgi:Sec7-like guanine-nucleotide exchange factor